MKSLCVYSTFCILLLCGCTTKEYKSLFIGEPEIIKDFNFSSSLEEFNDFYCDEIGINGVKVVDSLLIVGHPSYWTLINMNDGKHKDILSVGEGPDDFYSLPRCSSAVYVELNDSLYAFIPDKTNSRIMHLNVSRSMSDGETNGITYEKNNILKNEVWDVIMCDTASFWMSVPNESFTGFKREICNSDSIYEPEITQEMSRHTVNENINLLSRVTRYNRAADKFVEAMVYLNQINIYSRDGKSGKTICVGKQLDNVNEIEDTPRLKLKNTYNSVAAWDMGFGAVYSGHTDMEIETGQTKGSEIQFFNWDGKPVMRVKFPYEILSIDLDIDNQVLYVIDAEKDALRKYNAKPIIKSYAAV